MIGANQIGFAVIALGWLVLNFYAFRSDAAAAGHGRKQKLQMAAIWFTVIAGLAAVLSHFDVRGPN